MVNVVFFAKHYEVPEGLTIIKAMEYVGIKLSKGVACGDGFCGACACLYRINGEKGVHPCLACQKEVEEGMMVLSLPAYSVESSRYDDTVLEEGENPLLKKFPELDNCLECGMCTQSCPKGIDVQGYIEKARYGQIKECAEMSFACVMCRLCEMRCTMSIPQASIGMLARRIVGVENAKNDKHRRLHV